MKILKAIILILLICPLVIAAEKDTTTGPIWSVDASGNLEYRYGKLEETARIIKPGASLWIYDSLSALKTWNQISHALADAKTARITVIRRTEDTWDLIIKEDTSESEATDGQE